MNKTIKISIIAAIILVIGAVGVWGYIFYKQQQTKNVQTETQKKTTEDADKEKTPDKVIELKAGSGPAPATESPIPAGVAGPAPLPD